MRRKCTPPSPVSPADTVAHPVATPDFPVCSFCTSLTTTELWTWSFNVGNTVVCGKVDTAIVTFERTAFTFFGPSSCSDDTGIVVTVYLENDTLNRNITNLNINKVSFRYYDNVTPSHIFLSQASHPFSAVINSYDQQTKIAAGIFIGDALRADGSIASITWGKLKVKLF
jgi:hypothetical protein